MLSLVFFCFASLAFGEAETDPSYDHQNTTYYANIKPDPLTNMNIDITPYFSPDHSVQLEVELILGAFSKIDVMIPGFDSWAGCSYPGKEGCIGCDPWYVRNNESFPIFQALLDAVNRGVKVRILTNDYETPICSGKMDPLTFIQLSGADVRYFRTVTFLHDKYISRDNDATAISSINYSYTSFMKNREAGIVFEDTSGTVSSYLGQVFEKDWNMSYAKTTPHYTDKELEPVRNKSQIPVRIPVRRHFDCEISSPVRTILSTTADLKYYVSPDYAFDTIMNGLDSAKSSLMVYIYQITCPTVGQKLIDIAKRGVKVDILVSCAIYGEDDRNEAFSVYQSLLKAGIKIRMTMKGCYSYAHQKYWVIDEKEIWLSSGNWSPSDLPQPPYIFPVYGDEGWRKVNRDMSFSVNAGSDLVEIFKEVYYNDYNQGFDYTGSTDFLKRVACD